MSNEDFFHQLTSKLDETCKTIKASRDPNVFAVFLRSGNGQELEFQSWIYEEVERRSGLEEGWSDHATEFEFRSSQALWEVALEFRYSMNEANRELLKPIPERYNQHPYTLEVVDNLPLRLKPYMQILDFESWGEALYVDYDQMKVDAMESSVTMEELKTRLDEISDLERRFPNKYTKDLRARCIRIKETKPQELVDEMQEHYRQFQELLSSPEGRDVLDRIGEFDRQMPNPPVVNGRINTQDPSYTSYRESLDAWNHSVQTWMDGIQTPRLRNLVDFRPGLAIYLRSWPFDMVPI